MRALWSQTDATATNVAAISRQRSVEATWNGKIMPDGEWFPIMAFALWHQKVAACLQVAFLEGGAEEEVSDRTLRSWASGGSEPPATRLAFMLRSSDGDRVLDWIMRGSEQVWWVRYQRAQRISDALKAELRE